jgi:ketosteroid isomerase-like protein
MTNTQDLLDKLAIREVLERYMRFNDDRAADRIVELFDEDAVFQVMGKLIVGRAAIHAMFRGDAEAEPKLWTEPGELLKQPGSLHLCANPVIDTDGNTATSELDFHVVSRNEEGRARTLLIGRYRDRLRRLDDGRWVITHRVGVSVARPGEAGTSPEWDRALAALPDEDRNRFLT